MAHGFGKFGIPVAVVRCVHHLGDADGFEHVGQDRFLGLTGKADLGISRQKFAFSITYRQRCVPMSPKCLHGGDCAHSKWLKLAVRDCDDDPDLNIEGMETSWRHQSASSLNNECFFPTQDTQSCE